MPGESSAAQEPDGATEWASASAASAADSGRTSELDSALSTFMGVRPRLFGIAYRMLGSATEAEDILQEVWIRWQGYDRAAVRDAPAFLATTTTRLAINTVTSARVRREAYIGPWLPEPVDTSADPALGAEHGEALEFAVLLMLETLSPTERAAYVLREAFDYPYSQIAEVIRQTEANSRQLVSRARKHLAEGKREAVSAHEQQRLLDSFVSAAQTGNLTALEELLSEDVVSYSDGGGVVRASRIPVLGRDHVSKYIKAFASRFWEGVSVGSVMANGQAAVRLSRDGVDFAVVSITASAAGIDQVLWMMNPGKLGRIVAPTT